MKPRNRILERCLQGCECVPVWNVNFSSDAFLGCVCQDSGGERMLVTVTAPHQSRCYVRLPFSDLTGRRRQFKDLMGSRQLRSRRK
jgi:hypothetical protein